MRILVARNLSRRRGATLAVLVAWASTEAVVTAHGIATAHTRCSEHGKIVHADGRQAPGTNRGPRREASLEPSGAARPGPLGLTARAGLAGDADRHGHDHCAAGLTTEEKSIVADTSGSAMDHALGSKLRESPVAASHPSIALLRYAPKSSPPLA